MGAFEKAWGLLKRKSRHKLMLPMDCPECKGPMEYQDGFIGSSGRFVEPAYMCMDPQTPYCESRRHDVKSSMREVK